MDKRIIEIGRKNAVVHMILNVAETTNMDEKETLISIILDLVQVNEIILKRNGELKSSRNELALVTGAGGGYIPKSIPMPGGNMKCRCCGSYDATMIIDPYASEIYGDDELAPLCDDCEQTRRDDI